MRMPKPAATAGDPAGIARRHGTGRLSRCAVIDGTSRAHPRTVDPGRPNDTPTLTVAPLTTRPSEVKLCGWPLCESPAPAEPPLLGPEDCPGCPWGLTTEATRKRRNLPPRSAAVSTRQMALRPGGCTTSPLNPENFQCLLERCVAQVGLFLVPDQVSPMASARMDVWASSNGSIISRRIRNSSCDVVRSLTRGLCRAVMACQSAFFKSKNPYCSAHVRAKTSKFAIGVSGTC